MVDLLVAVVRESWQVAAQMSPWLLLGFLVAGVLSTVIDPVWLERHLGGRGFGPVLKASAFGVPLPLCSCGVIPVAASLRSHGASRAATTAFLLSTPQTGVDSVLITWTMLGPVVAVFRPVVALVTGLVGGGLVQAFVPEPLKAAPPAFPQAPPPAAARAGVGRRLRATLAYGLITLPADLGRPLLLGVVLAGVIGAVVPSDFVARYVSPGPLSILMMILIGIPLYVCATASVPLAAGFIFMGVSPGAALAFLIAGPATNAAALTTIGRVLGRRALGLFLLTIAVGAFASGLLLDALLPWLGRTLPGLEAMPHHHEQASAWSRLAAVALTVVMVHAWWRTRRRPSAGSGGKPEFAAAPATSTQDFMVEGMHCSQCVQSVGRAVGGLAGVVDCQVDLQGGRVRVTGTGVDPSAVVGAVEALGYRGRALTG